jgi:fructose-bisphosphate aldolase, class II
MIVTTDLLFEHAYGNYAVGAYNINNAEQIMGMFRGNMDSKAPFIVQLSKGARGYTDTRLLEAMIRAADEIFPEAIFAVHLDHGDEQTCYECIDSGFYSSVMIDASAEEFDQNVAITKRVVDAAHAKGVVVEAELGKLGGVEEHVSVDEADAKLTDPKQVEEFVSRTGCDSLACAIGTSHGAYKFTGGQGLHFNVIEDIAKLLPRFPLVMHGSSSVPQDEVQRINAAGGKLGGAKGVDEVQISRASKMGVTKVNIDTDGRLVWCRVHREAFQENPENFDLRGPGKVFMAEYANYIAHKNEVLGSAGQLESVREFIQNKVI